MIRGNHPEKEAKKHSQRQIGQRPCYGHVHHIPAGIMKISPVDRNRFGPTKTHEVKYQNPQKIQVF